MKKSGEARRRAQDGASCSKCTELFESERNSAFRLKVPKQANRQMAHRVLHMKHVFIPLRSPEWHQWRQKGIAATEAAVVCVNSRSPLTVPHNLCERPCRRLFSKTARVFFRTAIVEMLFTESTIFRIFKASTWNSTLRPSSTWHCSLSLSLRSQSA